MGGTRFKFESWRVRNRTQNAHWYHFYRFLIHIWILKSGCSLKSPTHAFIFFSSLSNYNFIIQDFLFWSENTQLKKERKTPKTLAFNGQQFSMWMTVSNEWSTVDITLETLMKDEPKISENLVWQEGWSWVRAAFTMPQEYERQSHTHTHTHIHTHTQILKEGQYFMRGPS